MPFAPRNRRSGFTLIELLVVIAIIAILAAILFPVFAQARAKARQAACLSNTKQIGMAMMQYAQDYDETFPGYRFSKTGSNLNPFASDPDVGPNAKDAIFISQVLDTYAKSYDIWRCPSNPNSWVNVDKDGVMGNKGSGFQSYGGQNSYAVNNYLFPSNAGRAIADIAEAANTVGLVDASYYNALPRGINAPGGKPCALKGDPTGTAFVTGSSYPNYWKNLGNSYWGFSDLPNPSDTQADDRGKSRHSEFLNIIWMDGHAKAQKWEVAAYDPELKVGSNRSIWDPYKQGCN